jgi:hypothetical protein
MPTYVSLARRVVLAGLLVAGAALAPTAAAETIPLPQDDRAALEQLLGTGVIGDPVDASPLSTAEIPLREGTWTYQIVAGNKQGQTENDVLTKLERDPSGASWQVETGSKDLAFVETGPDDNIAILSEQDTDQGVITRFSPAEPILINGMNPGDNQNVTLAVNVYDLSDPQEVSHSGSLQLAFSYVGAYRVTVPAGSYDAMLLKWVYDGSVGPASVKDTQYRFIAKDVGIVASIEKKRISALLLYHDNSNTGRVLTKAPELGPSVGVIGCLARQQAPLRREVQLGLVLVARELRASPRCLLVRDPLQRPAGRHRQHLVAAGAL